MRRVKKKIHPPQYLTNIDCQPRCRIAIDYSALNTKETVLGALTQKLLKVGPPVAYSERKHAEQKCFPSYLDQEIWWHGTRLLFPSAHAGPVISRKLVQRFPHKVNAYSNSEKVDWCIFIPFREGMSSFSDCPRTGLSWVPESDGNELEGWELVELRRVHQQHTVERKSQVAVL